MMTMMINKSGSPKNNIRGFTLLELMVSVTILGVLTVLVSIGVTQIVKLKIAGEKAVELQQNTRSISRVLPLYLGQAVNVDWTNSPITNIGSNRGRLLSFISSLETSPNPQPIPIGIFLRESGNPSAGGNSGELRATGIYFKNPTPTTSGELIFSSSNEVVGGKTLSPNNSVLRFDNIVEFEIKPGGYNALVNSPVRVAHVRIVSRKFLSNQVQNLRFCPEGQNSSAACTSDTNYRDIERNIFITLPNNTLTTSDYVNTVGTHRRETLYGDIYFFRPSGDIIQ